jgi:uncharacterized membrane protein YfcA
VLFKSNNLGVQFTGYNSLEEFMMKDTKTQSIQAAIRLAIAIIGAVCAALGHHIDSSILQTLDIAIGSFAVALMAAWSQWNIQKVEAQTKAREVMAVRIGQTIADGTVGPTPLVAASEVPTLIRVIAPKLPPLGSISIIPTQVAEQIKVA